MGIFSWLRSRERLVRKAPKRNPNGYILDFEKSMQLLEPVYRHPTKKRCMQDKEGQNW